MAKIILIGSGPWPTKVQTALEKVGSHSHKISYGIFNGLSEREMSELASKSIIWVCSRPANQIRVIDRLSNFDVKVILEKPLVTNKKELKELNRIIKKSNCHYFISQVWTFSDIWRFIKNNVDFYNTSLIRIERFGMNRRSYLSPPQDWLPHDIYLIHDAYGKVLVKSKIYKTKSTLLDAAELKILIKNGPEIQITGGNKDGKRIMKWEFSSQNKNFIFNFIDNSADIFDYSNQNWLHINFEKGKEISRMVRVVDQASVGDDLVTIMELYNKILI